MTAGSARHRHPTVSYHAQGRLPTILLLVAVFTGACGAFAWTTRTHPMASPAPAPVVLSVPAPARSIEAAVPVRIDIPDIAVSAVVESLVRTNDGSLGTPQNFDDAGWYSQGVTPGDPGPAIVVGHRDSATDGPAVFYRLGELAPGDLIIITESDGNTTTFAVQSLRQVAKSDFPTTEVYGLTDHRLLRLITCTGGFDYTARSYLDNLVVTARAV